MSMCAICTGRHDEADCPKGIVFAKQCKPVVRSVGWRPTVTVIRTEASRREPEHPRLHTAAYASASSFGRGRIGVGSTLRGSRIA